MIKEIGFLVLAGIVRLVTGVLSSDKSHDDYDDYDYDGDETGSSYDPSEDALYDVDRLHCRSCGTAIASDYDDDSGFCDACHDQTNQV